MKPPSQVMHCPVTNELVGPSRNKAKFAMKEIYIKSGYKAKFAMSSQETSRLKILLF